jgi:vitamin B12 transporter
MPRNKISGLVTFYLPYDLTASLNLTWRDAKVVPLYDSDYNEVRWSEPSSTTVAAAVTYTLFKHYQLFMRAENLINEHYTENGYLMPGRSIYGGVNLMF